MANPIQTLEISENSTPAIPTKSSSTSAESLCDPLSEDNMLNTVAQHIKEFVLKIQQSQVNKTKTPVNNEEAAHHNILQEPAIETNHITIHPPSFFHLAKENRPPENYEVASSTAIQDEQDKTLSAITTTSDPPTSPESSSSYDMVNIATMNPNPPRTPNNEARCRSTGMEDNQEWWPANDATDLKGANELNNKDNNESSSPVYSKHQPHLHFSYYPENETLIDAPAIVEPITTNSEPSNERYMVREIGMAHAGFGSSSIPAQGSDRDSMAEDSWRPTMNNGMETSVLETGNEGIVDIQDETGGVEMLHPEKKVE
ncbi:hypothetical protein BDN71DRAFT_1430258 [Pleurotus eryngii]|uniref:Uncharacterized protein n=1 Tax=Pleurotus eryngii TaxID=5323 RepID=A0A9P6A1I6_PLEER|nr:hypothetical protein BDN71DRAFT_1430258 [Pleurotus eryngii]